MLAKKLSFSLRSTLKGASLWLPWLVLLFALDQQLLRNHALADTSSASGKQNLSIAMLAAETRFENNTMNLTPAGLKSLQQLIIQLDNYREILSIRIIGHTDSVGSKQFNQSLSQQRANSIRENFVKKFKQAHLIAVGMGESQPIAKNDTEDGRERNRRVEIQVIARGYIPTADSNGSTNN